MATTSTAQANATMPLSSSCLASAVETFFYFFERKEKKKN